MEKLDVLVIDWLFFPDDGSKGFEQALVNDSFEGNVICDWMGGNWGWS